MMEKQAFNRIGKYCRNYRLTVLNLTLQEVAGKDNIKTLSSFEHGRSKNIEHLLKYISKCKTREQKLQFLEGLISTIEGSEIDGK